MNINMNSFNSFYQRLQQMEQQLNEHQETEQQQHFEHQDSQSQQQQEQTTPPRTAQPHPSMNPNSNYTNNLSSLSQQFRSKAVCQLFCKFCCNEVCKRGMKAILLGDISIELFSTDLPPTTAVELVNDEYTTQSCQCRIRDVACLECGNVVGYHVTTPCTLCLSACHNGHFWMFHSQCLTSSERIDHRYPYGDGIGAANKVLLWGSIPHPLNESEAPGKNQFIERPPRRVVCLR